MTVDDEWGRSLLLRPRSRSPPSRPAADAGGGTAADWTVTGQTPRGLGTGFTLTGPDGASLRVHTGLPGSFNVANAALATVMVLARGWHDRRRPGRPGRP